MADAKTIILKSYPKVNLALDILGIAENGYHKIQTVFHLLNGSFDEIILQPANRTTVDSDNPHLPTDKTNTVTKAALLLQKHGRIRKGAKIFIRKHIPLMSGLGGGASNAVDALKGLAKLWDIKCCNDPDSHVDPNCILRKIANQIGMDCAFFFDGGTAIGENFGEKITQLLPLPADIKFEIIKTGVEISSRSAYQSVDIARCGKNTAKTKALIDAIRSGDTRRIIENAHNDFEEFILKTAPSLAQKERAAKKQKPGRILLCGSGGALVRIFV